MIEFTVHGKPNALKRHRDFLTKSGARVHVDPSKGDKADFLAMAMQHRPEKPLDCPLGLKVDAYFPYVGRHYGSKNKQKYLKNPETWFTGTPDIDNIVKFVMDALNKIFWTDDKQIVSVSSVKKYSETPRVEVLIWELDDNDD